MNTIIHISNGLLNMSWWEYVVTTLVLTHITILSVTIYLHRASAHRALTMNPIVSNFFRFWLWMTTGIITKEWVAIHRKHHAFADKPGDPHSPIVFGVGKVFFEGAELYKKAALNKEDIEHYGKGTPNDWMEKNIYKHDLLGVFIMFMIDIFLFGAIGISIWAIQMVWIPLMAAGVINGVGHWFGYRSFENPDNAKNIFPIGLLIGGEELHNNHHTYGTSAKLSVKWYEFDIGWFWIKLLSVLGLVKVKRSIPIIVKDSNVSMVKNLESLIIDRYRVASNYAESMFNVCKQDLIDLKLKVPTKFKRTLSKEPELYSPREREEMNRIAISGTKTGLVIKLRMEFSELCKSRADKETLIEKLKAWYNAAENSGIQPLKNFAIGLRSNYAII